MYIKLPLALLAISLVLPLLTVGSTDGQAEESIIYGPLSIDARIENHYAMTTFTGHVSNPSGSGEDTTMSIKVPEDAMISNLSINIDGITSYAVVAQRAQAQQEYEEAKEEGETVTQLRASTDPTMFYLDLNIHAKSDISFSLRYEQVLVKKMYNFTYLLPFGVFSNANLFNELDVNIDIQGMGNITPVNIQKGTLTPVESWMTTSHARYSYNSSMIDKTSSIGIVYREMSPPVDGTLDTYMDDTGGYFIHVFSPRLSDLGTYLPKDVIFVLDRSGSMGGRKIEQLKDAFSEIVHQVHDEDRFNIISFSSETDRWNAEMVQANKENKDSSVQYLNYMDPAGSTNINQALLDALGMYQGDVEAVPIIVFLTDGLPTTGVTDIPTIRENILYGNTNRVSIYSLGFGNDVDLDFLSALSLENRGFAVRIPESEDASMVMQGFYETISVPLLHDLYFNYTAGATDVIPQTMPSLFAGSEAVIVGRFDRTRESITSTITASSSEGPQVFEESWKTDQDQDLEFIPRLWAHRMILHYMEQMLVEGETEYLQQKVIDLAMDYSFVTTYTSFILVVTDPNDPPVADYEGTDDEGSLYNRTTGGYPGVSDLVPSTIDDDDNDPISEDDYEGNGGIIPALTDDDDGISMIMVLLVMLSFIVVLVIVGLVIFGYTRIRREDLLNQENRKKIYEHITDNPGEHFRGLQRAVDLEVGVLSHHLNVLEKEQLIVSEQDGSNRCFWAAGVKHDTDKVRLSRVQENILKEIHEDPGITQSQIAKNMGVSRKVIFYHVKFLRNAGVVREEKDSKRSHYYER
ncbi:MAG: VWA domain-containing protein [Candidatus Thermoplasmatota archaeon]|nr:VWA domain-containing protein [Candidatus Thermoplasmatota archaeon]